MGHAGDMINRIKQNRAKQRKGSSFTRNKFKDLDHSFVKSYSEKEKKAARSALKEKIENDNVYKKLMLISILIILSIILYWLFR